MSREASISSTDPDLPPPEVDPILDQLDIQSGPSILDAVAESAGASWLGRLASVTAEIAPMAIAVGLAALVPEAAPIVATLGEDAALAINDAIDIVAANMASHEAPDRNSWAELQIQTHQGRGTLDEAIRNIRKIANAPRHSVTSVPEHNLPEKAKKQAAAQKAAAWVDKHVNKVDTSWLKNFYKWKANRDAKYEAHRLQTEGLPINEDMDRPEKPQVPPKAKVIPGLVPSEGETVHFEDSENVWVETGDHSVEATDITAELLMSDKATEVGPAEFFRKIAPSLRDRAEDFQHIPNVGYQLGSWITPVNAVGGTDVAHHVWGNVLQTHEAPIALNNDAVPAVQVRWDLHVHTGQAREIGRFDAAYLTALYQGNLPSERFISSAINPNLPFGDLNQLKAITGEVQRSWEIYDNSLLYAKLLYYALLGDIFLTINQVQQAQAWGQGAPTWINISPPAAQAHNDITAVPNALTRKDIIFLYNQDIFLDDLVSIYYLTSDGLRINGQDGHETPHACYVQWPKIQVTILAHEALPAVPAVVALTPTQIYGFCSRIATQRSEWGSYVKGLYLAMDIIGTRMVGHQGQWTPLRSCLSPRNPWVNAVADYNFMYRLLKIFPKWDPDALQEVEAFTSLSSLSRVRAITMYNAVIGSATTTLLYDFNATAGMLSSWCSAAVEPSPHFNQIMDKAMNRPGLSHDPREPLAFSSARKAFKLWLGIGVHPNLYPEDSWLGHFGNVGAGRAHCYDAMNQNTPPRNFNPMIIDDWMIVRPMEWGYAGPRPFINLDMEIIQAGPAATQGWYANMGSSRYQEMAESQFPMGLVVYGVQALNIMTQYLRLVAGAAPAIQHTDTFWMPYSADAPRRQMPWTPPALIPAADIPYVVESFGLEPCRLMSYDYANQMVRAPVLYSVTLEAGAMSGFAAMGKVQLRNTGLLLRQNGRIATPFALPAELDLSMIGGIAAAPTSRPMQTPKGAEGQSGPSRQPPDLSQLSIKGEASSTGARTGGGDPSAGPSTSLN